MVQRQVTPLCSVTVQSRGNYKFILKSDRTVGVEAEDIAIGAGGLGFDCRAGQIWTCRQRFDTAAMFLCCPGAMPRSTRYMVRRGPTNIMKTWFWFTTSSKPLPIDTCHILLKTKHPYLGDMEASSDGPHCSVNRSAKNKNWQSLAA